MSYHEGRCRNARQNDGSTGKYFVNNLFCVFFFCCNFCLPEAFWNDILDVVPCWLLYGRSIWAAPPGPLLLPLFIPCWLSPSGRGTHKRSRLVNGSWLHSQAFPGQGFLQNAIFHQGFSQDFRIRRPKIHIWGELGVQFLSSHCIIHKKYGY